MFNATISDTNGMKKEDIEHLASLSRITLHDDEINELSSDISEILEYVSVVNEITSESSGEKKVGPLNTVLREDGEPHEPGIYSEDLLNAVPARDRNYIKVKKILHNDD